jgi:hypothetical protein
MGGETLSSTDMTSRGRDLERERDFRCGSSLGTWRYWVLGMVVGYGGAISRRLRTVVAQDEDSMWHVAYGMADRAEGKGRWLRRFRSSLVGSGHGCLYIRTTRQGCGLASVITALGAVLLLLMKDNGMGCAGWLEGWLDVLTTFSAR